MHLYLPSTLRPSGSADTDTIDIEHCDPLRSTIIEGLRSTSIQTGPKRRQRAIGSVVHLLSRGADTIAFAVAYMLLAAALPIMLVSAPITRISSGDIDDD